MARAALRTWIDQAVLLLLLALGVWGLVVLTAWVVVQLAALVTR